MILAFALGELPTDSKRSAKGEGVVRFADGIRGYRLEFPAESIGDFVITLIQEPGHDFYDTHFRTTVSDGRSTRLMIDGDDAKWKVPRRVEREGRMCYLRSGGDLSGWPLIESDASALHAGYLTVPLS